MEGQGKTTHRLRPQQPPRDKPPAACAPDRPPPSRVRSGGEDGDYGGGRVVGGQEGERRRMEGRSSPVLAAAAELSRSSQRKENRTIGSGMYVSRLIRRRGGRKPGVPSDGIRVVRMKFGPNSWPNSWPLQTTEFGPEFQNSGFLGQF
jgi:hypothetical protein